MKNVELGIGDLNARIDTLGDDMRRGSAETAHLLRSPRNVERLLRALEGSRRREGRGFSSIEDVAAEIGL
ncbi:MAG: hypothetical protein ACRELT_15260 [Longimicrobiales bacterium]